MHEFFLVEKLGGELKQFLQGKVVSDNLVLLHKVKDTG